MIKPAVAQQGMPVAEVMHPLLALVLPVMWLTTKEIAINILATL
jgi:hypothetical protein